MRSGHLFKSIGAALLSSALGVACAPPKPADRAASYGESASAPADDATQGEAFLLAEEQAMDILAASDPRFAARRGVGPSDDSVQKSAVQALLAEDTDARVHQGALDVFSFAARARGLDAAAAKVKGAPAPTSSALEQALWGRLLDGERARLREEQDLPRGASELVRGMVETWGAAEGDATAPPPSPEEVHARDGWAATRLADVTSSLARRKLPTVELTELDDALDPLEHFAAPAEYPRTAGALARLRIALGEVTPAPARPDDWSQVREALAVHVDGRVRGPAGAPARLEALLAETDRRLRALIKEVDPDHRLDDRAVARSAEQRLFVPGRFDRISGSKVRSLSPPSERRATAGALQAAAGVNDLAPLVAVLEALHFEVTVASWAISVHGHGLDADHAEQATHSVLTFAPERQVRFVRLAVARPVTAIGTGLSVALLIQAVEARRSRAAAPGLPPASQVAAALAQASALWLAFGDAPLDVVEAALFSPRADESPGEGSARAPGEAAH